MFGKFNRTRNVRKILSFYWCNLEYEKRNICKTQTCLKICPIIGNKFFAPCKLYVCFLWIALTTGKFYFFGRWTNIFTVKWLKHFLGSWYCIWFLFVCFVSLLIHPAMFIYTVFYFSMQVCFFLCSA